MKNELEIEFQMKEMFGFSDRAERSRTQSLEKSTDAIDGFFERLEIKETLGCAPDEFERLVAERISSPDHEPGEVRELREFVKAEKPKVPAMSARQMRSSMIHLLRKTANAMAAI